MIMRCHFPIVDDDADLAELYSDIYDVCDVAESVGMKSSRYGNGNYFVQSSLDRRQILLLDLMMPQMDGIQVLRQLVKSEFKCPIILLCGYDEGALKLVMDFAAQ